MYVVVAGINILSRKIIKKLEGTHDVVVVEENEDKCKRLYSSSGATVINKNPSTLTALEDAGITQADVLIAAQKDDNENMVVCSLAKKYGVPKVISRVEDDEYLDAFEIIDAEAIGHTDILVEEFLAAVEHPYILKIANLPNNREILRVKIKRNSPLIGKTPKEVRREKNFPEKFQVSSIIKPEETVTNDLEQQIKQDDQLLMIGPQKHKEDLNNYFRHQ